MSYATSCIRRRAGLALRPLPPGGKGGATYHLPSAKIIMIMGDDPPLVGGRDFLNLIRRSNDLSFFNDNPLFDLRNLDFYQNLFEDIPFTPNSYTNLKSLKKSKDLRYIVLSNNICSLAPKIDLLANYIDELKLKNYFVVAVLIQESWQVGQILSLPGFKLDYVNRSERTGGGVATFIHQDFKGKTIKKIMHEGSLEAILSSIKTPGGKIINLVNIYHPPAMEGVGGAEHFENFNSKFSDVLGALDPSHMSIVSGDFNICLAKSSYYESFLTSIYENGHFLVSFLATRVKSLATYGFLDCATSNVPGLISEVWSGVDSWSDHDFTYILLDNKFILKKSQKDHIKKPKKTTFRHISDSNLENFRLALSNETWAEVFNQEELQVSYDKFYEIFFRLFNLNFPLKKTRTSIKSTPLNPWFSSKLRNFRSRLDDLKI